MSRIGIATAMVFWAIILLGLFFTVKHYYNPVEVAGTGGADTSAVSDCAFYKLVEGDGATAYIVENKAGEYAYEVYVTPRGLEVYKCDK